MLSYYAIFFSLLEFNTKMTCALWYCLNETIQRLFMGHLIGSWSKQEDAIRDGPLEKLWGGGGGWVWRIFEPQEIFFVIKFLVWFFFKPQHEYFLGLIGVHEFFQLIFPCANIFFCNGPSLSRWTIGDITLFRCRQAVAVSLKEGSSFLLSLLHSRGALRDDTKNGCVADYFLFGLVIESIWWKVFHFSSKRIRRFPATRCY